MLKTRKTAGTSVEMILSSWCDDRDICSPIHKDDEPYRQMIGGKPRNHLGEDGRLRYYNHMSAGEVRTVQPDLWSRAFKFSLERHPYEKVVSRAWWNVHKFAGSRTLDVAQEIDRSIIEKSYLNWPIYTLDGQVAVDKIVDYDDIWPWLDRFAKRLGTQMPTRNPTAKSGIRKDVRPARDILTTAQKESIYRDARFEFDLMGYAP